MPIKANAYSKKSAFDHSAEVPAIYEKVSAHLNVNIMLPLCCEFDYKMTFF